MQELAVKGKLPTLKVPSKKSKKGIIIAVICILAVAGGATAIILNKTQSTSAEASVVYREYNVEKGDITVGTEESGTLTVERSALTFPLNATVDSVLVKLGQDVTAGTPLVQLDLDSIADVTKEYETKIADAKKSLAEAIFNQKSDLVTAKLEYDTSVALNSTAPTENELSKTQLDYDITSDQATIDKLKTQLAKYTELQKSDDTDLLKLDELKANVSTLTDTLAETKEKLTDYTSDTQDDLTKYKALYNKYTSAQDSVESAAAELKYQQANATTATTTASSGASSSSGTNSVASAQAALTKAQYSLELAQQKYSNIEDDYDDINDELESLQAEIDSYTDKLSDANDAYNDFKETFDETYELSGTKLDDKVTSLTEEISSSEFNLEKKKKSYSSDVISADEKLTSELSTASTAQQKYTYTVNKLATAVATAQSAYDTLVKDYDEIKASITADGILTAACDGTVATIGYEAGANYQADQTLISLADKRYVFMEVSIAEEDITSIEVGQAAEVTLTAYEGQTFEAVVDNVAYEPARSSSAVTYTVTIKLTDESGKLDVYDGMSGEVNIIKKQVADVLYITNQAISYAGGKSTVIVKKSDGTQSSADVTTGFSDGRYVEISRGLSAGDTVLVESAVSAK